MSHEVARLAGTNRLQPLIVYDVAFPLSIPPPISILLSESPSLPILSILYGKPGFIRGGVEVTATENRVYFTAPDPFRFPTYSTPARPDTSGLFNPPGVATSTTPSFHPLLNGRMQQNLHSAVALGKTDFQ
ncbi:hypothetical protein GOODEAATRI_007753 [Goodea atripinnis]|uniref:Uncharacterized protein n=1 Tax=Goodea atripinnis TaxID=208336 RepID=A0ABV0NB81_9TELE